MVEMCISMPVLPGKARALRELGRQLSGPRAAEYRRSNKKQGISKEMWFLEKTPSGHQMLVYVVAKDPAKAVEIFIKSKDPFDVYERRELAKITGLDFSNPSSGPYPKPIMTCIVE